ncbi:glycosyltransferase [Sphingomonas sp. ASV193]|uniref:glycosyltransferase n=1 Tax=Sphingomonas sp. ASV193 TaxID=3144405 RepID=UPI0032E935B4
MRIGIVLHDFAFGGTERVAVRLANQWAARGHAVTLFVGQAGGPAGALVDAKVKVIEARPRIARAIGSRRRLAKAAAARFDAEPVDALFVPGNFHWPVVAAIDSIDPARRPAIVAQVSSALHKKDRGPAGQRRFAWLARRRLAGADALVVLAERTAGELRAMLGREAVVIPLPVLDQGAPPPCPLPGGDPLVVAAGRFVPQKDFRALVEAFARVRHPGARLAIVGDGPERPLVEARIAELGLADRVALPGYVADIRPWLDAARLFVLSSRHEGYAAVIVEALAAGRPVVTTDCTPAAAELLAAPERGTVVPIGAASALAAAIDAMLDRPAPDGAALAGATAPFGVAAVADAYLELFARLTTGDDD